MLNKGREDDASFWVEVEIVLGRVEGVHSVGMQGDIDAINTRYMVLGVESVP